jgi:hypothetical protein
VSGAVRLGEIAYPVRDPGPAVLAELTAAHADVGEDLAELLEWVWDALDRLLPGCHVVTLQKRVDDPGDALGHMELVLATLGLWYALCEQHADEGHCPRWSIAGP